MSELVRSFRRPDGGELRAVLSDDGWRLVFHHGDAAREVFVVDPGALAALLLNRDLREVPGTPRPDSKEATARRIGDASTIVSPPGVG